MINKTIGSLLVLALIMPCAAVAQIADGVFRNSNLPQSLKRIAGTERYDAYLDQNRRIVHADGSVTIQAVHEFHEPREDGARSRALIQTYYCSEKDGKKYASTEFYNYSGPKLTGSLLGSGKREVSKEAIKPKTVTDFLFDAACSAPVGAQSVPPESSPKNFVRIARLAPEQINFQVIRPGMSQTDLDVFLTMYAFIWSVNNWLDETPDPGSTRWLGNRVEQHRAFSVYRSNAQLALNRFEETISSLAVSMGLASRQFKQAIGIVEVFVPPACDRCDPGHRTLKSNNAGTMAEVLSRSDVTSNGISAGIKAFYRYTDSPGTEAVKNNTIHPAVELSPSVFFEFYSKWIPGYFLEPSRLSKLRTVAATTEDRLEQEQLRAEQETARRLEAVRQRQEYLNSPEGKRQLANEQAEEKRRQSQFAKDFPFYAVITCGGTFQVHACFSGRVPTELELRNGPDYKMYTAIDIMQIPQSQPGISFDLRSKFNLKMQNSNATLLLNAKVYDRATNAIVYEKSAARFGVIAIAND